MSEPSEAVLPVVGICAAREQAHWSFWDQPAHLVADSYVRRPHVALEEESLAAEAAGEGLHVAHCHHHQAIDTLCEGLVVSDRAVEDGLSEALEAADGRWILGVQLHPESGDESAIHANFVSTARDRAAEHAG